MKGISSLGHVAIRVNDIARSLDFYTGKLGFSELMRLHRDSGELWLIYLRITDDQYLELFPDAVGDRAPPKEANGLNHLCLTVDALDQVLSQLDAAGIPLSSPRKLGADGNLQAWIEDPDGNRIELMQMAPDGLQARAIAAMRAGGGA